MTIKINKTVFRIAFWTLSAAMTLEASQHAEIQPTDSQIALEQADIVEKDDLFIVIGSNRKMHEKGRGTPEYSHFIMTPLWDEKNARLTPPDHYTTIDLKPSMVPGAKHFIGNAETYDFSAYKIQEAYFERMSPCSANNLTRNTIGHSLKNIGKSMVESGILEIEWHAEHYQDSKDPTIENIREPLPNCQDNPFVGFFNTKVARLAAYLAAEVISDPDYPPHVLEAAQNIRLILEECLSFYSSQGVGTLQELKERLKLELWVFDILSNRVSYSFMNTLNSSASYQELSELLKKMDWDPQMNLLEDEQRKIPDTPHDNQYKTFDFEIYSLYNFIFADVTAIQNTPRVIKFLEDNGFKDVTLTRTTSPLNKRKNVWMIRGLKLSS